MTPDELKTKHAAMTPGEWELNGLDPSRICGPVAGTGPRLTSTVAIASASLRSNGELEANAIGIVALHNHFPALMRRYEEMRAALDAALDPDPCSFDHHGYCQAHGLGNPCEQSLIRAALANTNKPLEDA